MDDYLESPMESDDVFPCKGCGEVSSPGRSAKLPVVNPTIANIASLQILEEGKAFELGKCGCDLMALTALGFKSYTPPRT